MKLLFMKPTQEQEPYIGRRARKAPLLIRSQKIYRKHIGRRWNTIAVPEIRLCGKWLEQIGFQIGDKIEVHCGQNKITITKSTGTLVGEHTT